MALLIILLFLNKCILSTSKEAFQIRRMWPESIRMIFNCRPGQIPYSGQNVIRIVSRHLNLNLTFAFGIMIIIPDLKQLLLMTFFSLSSFWGWSWWAQCWLRVNKPCLFNISCLHQQEHGTSKLSARLEVTGFDCDVMAEMIMILIKSKRIICTMIKLLKKSDSFTNLNELSLKWKSRTKLY